MLKTLIDHEKKTGQKVEAEIVTWRGMMTKLFQAPFEDRDGYENKAMMLQTLLI